ncbi:MAG: ABC transporter permease [Planctomycetota bacterium]
MDTGAPVVRKQSPPGGAGLVRLLALTAARRSTSDRLLGPLWWVLDPLILVGVYALVFGSWLGLRHGPEGLAYPLFLACALIPWRWFSTATISGANAFVRNGSLLTSVPLRRGSVVLAEQLATLAVALAGLPILALFMWFYDKPATWELLWLPVPLAVLALLSAGISYVLCPLTVLLPDAANAWGAVMRILWFLSPGLYSVERVPDAWRSWYEALNPFVGILEGVRRPVHDAAPPLWGALGWSALWAVALWIVGRMLFRRLSADAVRML